MPKTAILIPSRNETYLFPTIRECFTKAESEIEVVAVLEGYWPSGWKELTDQFPNLHTIHHGEPRGLRAAINSAAASAISRGAKYLLKLDAHCILDEGYDTKLQADMESNWIVVPRRKRLNAESWTVQDVGKPDVDYHYLSFPDDPNDFGGKGLNGKVWYERIKERLDKPEYEIDDEMSSQGSCWFMAASYFQELELMDEASYGPFWNEFQECGMKCWLSGGQVKVNKKTWYAHLHKGRDYKGEDGKGGRGYHLPESWLTQGATFTKEWIWNEAWPKQTLPFSWLIEHFWPVPSWPENWEEVLYAERKPRVVQGYEIGVDVASGEDRTVVHDGEGNFLEGLIILTARYGISEDEWIDVRERLQSLVSNNSLDIVVNNSTLTPGENPFRGKAKTLSVTYSYDGAKPQLVQRKEKDWLIIGQVSTIDKPTMGEQYVKMSDVAMTPQQVEQEYEEAKRFIEDTKVKVAEMRHDPVKFIQHVGIDNLKPSSLQLAVIDEISKPMSAPALNDYLIRKFSISPQRLRGPMPIELRDFHRNDLAQLFAELGFTKGCEVGVAEGKFSEILCKANPELHLLCVDPWHSYKSNPQSKTKEKDEFAYRETQRRLAPYPNVKLDMRLSMDAVRDVEDDSLDFVNIDGHHGFRFAMLDLLHWSMKVRTGGIILLDDYIYLDRKRWGAGVVEAVQAFTSANEVNPWFICDADRSVDAFFVKGDWK